MMVCACLDLTAREWLELLTLAVVAVSTVVAFAAAFIFRARARFETYCQCGETIDPKTRACSRCYRAAVCKSGRETAGKNQG